ncbi:MAG TPA: class I SAM-dependent methyltransferase [Gaiellaceae bacterium]|nr:class I SAM-dependent methyltransferase [Gaiellaceae bacterium]
MGQGLHGAAAAGFARAPEDYERGRPGYPRAAVERLASALGLRPGVRVLDLAAGTGKLTRALAGTGAEVVAVEPVAEMRAALVASLPSVQALAGAAEAVPLAAGAVDAVACGQAFHWFRGEEALAEIHRVLRPGGRLGLVWNVRDEGVPWVAELTGLMEPYRGDAPRAGSGAWRDAFARTRLFAPLERASFRHVHRLPPEGVVARVASVSFVAALPESERTAVLERVRALLASSPATRGRGELELPYRADVWWCSRGS